MSKDRTEHGSQNSDRSTGGGQGVNRGKDGTGGNRSGAIILKPKLDTLPTPEWIANGG